MRRFVFGAIPKYGMKKKNKAAMTMFITWALRMIDGSLPFKTRVCLP